MRGDIKVRQWSLLRFKDAARRDSRTLVLRMSKAEDAALQRATIECCQKNGDQMLRQTDVVRGCLIYCGVFPDEPADEPEKAEAENEDER